MSSLYVMRGRDQGRRFELDHPVISIGRESGNSIRLRDTEVSRRHGEIRQDGDGWVLVDLGSSNGTFIEQNRIETHRLRTGDRIQIGKTWLLFTRADEAPFPIDHQVDIVNNDQWQDLSQIIARSERSVLQRADGTNHGTERGAIADLEIMLRAAQAASHTLDLVQLCDRLLELIFEAVQADRGCIMLTNSESGQLEPQAVRYRSASKHERLVISRSILDYVIAQGQGILTRDARDDERWETGASILRQGIREAICVPMQGRYGIVGAIYVDTKVRATESLEARQLRRFRDDQLNLMVAIGQQAALAVEDTSFYSAMVQSERLAAIGETVAMLSHHIKNILQGLRGGSYLIKVGIGDQDQEAIEEGWKIVERSRERIQQMVLDMLTFSKERTPDLELAQLNDTVKEIGELMARTATEQKTELVVSLDPQLPIAKFDREGIHRAILNLVTNAIEACDEREGGRVELSTSWDPTLSRLMVSIVDNGAGIAAEDQERIFRPFESTKGHRGTGLGLPATRKIVREHGGEVEVTSELDRGSKFLLWIPIGTESNSGPSSDNGPEQTLFGV